MPRSPQRTRRLAKRLLLIAAICIVLGTISLFSEFGVLLGDHCVFFFHGGSVRLMWAPGAINPADFGHLLGPFFILHTDPWWWGTLDWNSFPGWWVAGLPLWAPTIILLDIGLYLLYRTRPSILGLCTKCHYNLTGLPPSSPCPECGTPPPQKGA